MQSINRSRRRPLWSGVTLITLAPALVAAWWCLVPIRYHFDATGRPTPAEFGWTAPGRYIGRSEFELRVASRSRTVTLDLPDLQPYEEPAASRMFLDAEDGKVRAVKIHSVSLTLDEALDRVRHWSKVWDFDIGDLEAWRIRAERGDRRHVAAGRFARAPGGLDIRFEVWQSFNEEQPWYVSFNLYWIPME